MSAAVTIRDLDGTREVDAERFPLRVGFGTGSDIRLPGEDPAEPVALVGLAEHRPFVQPLGEAEIAQNGMRLAGSSWLRDGDTLSLPGATLHCTVSAHRYIFQVGPPRAAPQTIPPGEPPPEPPGGGLRPLPYRPEVERAARGLWLRRTAAGLLLATLALLGSAVWFVLGARFVTVQVEPVPDLMALQGGWLRPKLGEGYLLRPGRYTVVAEKAGYHRLEAPLEVTAARSQRASFKLEKLPGRLSVRTRPDEAARLTVDGTERGTTPLTVEALAPGEHAIQVRSPRYLDARATIDIQGGGIEQSLELVLVPRWAPVTVTSAPVATLWVDGEESGPVPITVELFEGEHDLELRREGFKPWRQRISVAANQPQTLPEVTLEPADGLLELTSTPSGANVSVNGEYAGQTPLVLALAPDRDHRLSLSKAGYGPVTREARVRANAREALAVPLTPITGAVDVVAEPAGAEVWVDGRPQGQGSRRLILPVVPHRIEVRRPGYAPYRVEIVPRRDYDQRLEVRLKPLEVARRERRPRQITAPDGQALVLIEPGELTLGASRREPGRRANETLRAVSLTRPFYLGTREVTNRQFREFRPKHESGSFAGLSLDGADRPVVNLTWEEAAEYCNWLSARAGLPPAYERRGGKLVAKDPLPDGYRLPTEAEWAWAARRTGKTLTRYPWGDSLPPPPRSGNYADASASRLFANTIDAYTDGFVTTADAGSFEPNPAGIYDLGGNVAEWMHDYYTIYPTSTAAPVRDPTGPSDGKHHVVRGSSWMHASISALRWTYRDYSEKPRPDLGFRIARYAP